jgi:hypothetical protein
MELTEAGTPESGEVRATDSGSRSARSDTAKDSRSRPGESLPSTTRRESPPARSTQVGRTLHKTSGTSSVKRKYPIGTIFLPGR